MRVKGGSLGAEVAPMSVIRWELPGAVVSFSDKE
jgi:hypothetical protein